MSLHRKSGQDLQTWLSISAQNFFLHPVKIQKLIKEWVHKASTQSGSVNGEKEIKRKSNNTKLCYICLGISIMRCWIWARLVLAQYLTWGDWADVQVLYYSPARRMGSMRGLIEQTLRCHPKQSRQSEPQISPAPSGNHSHLNPAAGWKGFEDYSERSLSFNQSAKPSQARVALVRHFRRGEEVGSEKCSDARLIRLQSNYFHTLTIQMSRTFFFFWVHTARHLFFFFLNMSQPFHPPCVFILYLKAEKYSAIWCAPPSFLFFLPTNSCVLPPMCVAQLKSFRLCLVILEGGFRVWSPYARLSAAACSP